MLKSERLQYRLYDLENTERFSNDIEEIFAIDQDPDVMRFITGGVTTTRESLENVFIPRIKSYTDIEKGFGMWRVGLIDTDACIGEVIVRPMDFFTDSPDYTNIELGWRFLKAHWGKGYATEAAEYLMKKTAKALSVDTFTAMAAPENTASINIMTKLGMTFKSREIHRDPLGDAEVDIYQVTI